MMGPLRGFRKIAADRKSVKIMAWLPASIAYDLGVARHTASPLNAHLPLEYLPA